MKTLKRIGFYFVLGFIGTSVYRSIFEMIYDTSTISMYLKPILLATIVGYSVNLILNSSYEYFNNQFQIHSVYTLLAILTALIFELAFSNDFIFIEFLVSSAIFIFLFYSVWIYFMIQNRNQKRRLNEFLQKRKELLK